MPQQPVDRGAQAPRGRLGRCRHLGSLAPLALADRPGEVGPAGLGRPAGEDGEVGDHLAQPRRAEDGVVRVAKGDRRALVEAQGASHRLDQADLLGIEAGKVGLGQATPAGPARDRRRVAAAPPARAAPGRAAPIPAAWPRGHRDGARRSRRWRRGRASGRRSDRHTRGSGSAARGRALADPRRSSRHTGPAARSARGESRGCGESRHRATRRRSLGPASRTPPRTAADGPSFPITHAPASKPSRGRATGRPDRPMPPRIRGPRHARRAT